MTNEHQLMVAHDLIVNMTEWCRERADPNTQSVDTWAIVHGSLFSAICKRMGMTSEAATRCLRELWDLTHIGHEHVVYLATADRAADLLSQAAPANTHA